MKFNDLIAHFKNVKMINNNIYRADCPNCGDTKQHLYISEQDGKILIDCKKGCKFTEIVAAANLKQNDFFIENKSEKWELLRFHIYTDEFGNTIAKKEIYKKCDNSKTAIWYRYENNGFIKGLNGLKMPLYHLHNVINADKNTTLYIVEGEKDVETMEKMGLIATTSPNGAGSKWATKKFNNYIVGRNIVILADNDNVGIEHANETAAAIIDSAKAVKVINSSDIYPNLKEKGDISDIVKEIGLDKTKKSLFETQKNTAIFSIDIIEKNKNNSFNFIENENKLLNDKSRAHTFTIELLQQFLNEKNIKIKYNIISHKTEITGVDGENFAQLNDNIISLLYNILPSLKGKTENRIGSFINVIASRNSYNPVLEMLKTVKWDNIDRLEEIYNIFKIEKDDNLSRILMKKWFMQCICGLHNNDVANPFSLDIVLVFQGNQGAGKTRFFEHLAMKKSLFGEGVDIDIRDKDKMIAATSKWICELGEIGSTLRRDIDSLKAFLSMSSDTYRAPYGHTAIEYNRLTSFCGTTNNEQFLIDETGNRRFATIPLKPDLYINYDEQVKLFDSLQFWKQIENMIDIEINENNKQYSNAFRLTREEYEQLAERNRKHEKPLKGEIEVIDVLTKISTMKESGKFNVSIENMTVTEFISINNELKNFTAEQIGKVLTKLGYPMKKKKINGSIIKIRELPKVKGAANYPQYNV